jgi:hypothetical protein
LVLRPPDPVEVTVILVVAVALRRAFPVTEDVTVTDVAADCFAVFFAVPALATVTVVVAVVFLRAFPVTAVVTAILVVAVAS